MATQVQRRRGTASEHNTFTGAAGEVTVNTTNDSLHVHDGATAGGIELSRADGQNANMPTSAMPAGTVLQMQSFRKDGTSSQSLSAQTLVQVSNIGVSITPFRSNSTMLIEVSLFFEISPDSPHDLMFSIDRNGVDIGAPSAGSRSTGIAVGTRSYDGNDASSTPNHLSMIVTDQPNTTSNISYALTARPDGNDTIFVNRCVSDSDLTNRERGVTTITVMEIAG